MKYLSLTSVKDIYFVLSQNTTTPDTQGATQKISAMRHLFAFYRYCVKNKVTECDLKIKANRDEFVDYVSEIVKLDGNNYTANFYSSIAELEDCRVGSNFYSAGVVTKSRINKTAILPYPTKHNLLNVQNEVLVQKDNVGSEISEYLTSKKIRLAFAFWLVRKDVIDDVNIIYDVHNKIAEKYSDELADSIIPNNDASKECLTNDFQLQFVPNYEELTKKIILSTIAETEKENMRNDNHPRQQIFYGAPGTGKSHEIKKTTDTMPVANVFRTTFHPDSDYSTFVGCYKPTMVSHERLYSQGELISKLTEIKKSGVTYPVHKFSAKYWESLKELTNDETKAILTACGFTDSMNVEVGKGIAIGQELAGHSENKKITYEFVPQAFLKAYKRAYETDETVVLVIEEINRGNCAQIFGDLFQLLDRKDGVSEYPIDADEDLRKYLIDTLGEDSPAIANGKLCLPPNLYIWATMNTSDQSLFPIDSAFKRRWDWKYTRIAQGKKEDGTLEHWKLENDTDWWDFLKKINAIIDDMTQSADKQLGYYFCKPDKENDTISYARFVNKVLFYLWNDIFKTFSTDEYEQLFKIKCLKTDADGKWIEPHELEDKEVKLTFPEFYDEKGDVIPEIAKQFIEKVIAWGGKPAAENA